MQMNKRVTSLWQTATVCGALLLGTTQALAADLTYGFNRITNNNTDNVASQLSITMWDAAGANAAFSLTETNQLSANELLFSVQNNVGIASNVSEVYFDDGLLGPSRVLNSLGGFTNFTGGGADPENLPSGNNASPPFVATGAFSADAQGSPNNGVNASADILGIVLGLGSFADFAAVASAVSDGSLRFGLHVRSIGTDGLSDSFVNEVPIPAAVWLFGSALLSFAGVARRKSAS